MIPKDHHIEVLAMNIWLGVFGVTVLLPSWIEWAKENPEEANEFRNTAETMIGAARSQAKKPTAPNQHHTHSLGWLLNG